MDYVMLKEICTINMGQSPDSSNYNDKGEGVPFFQGNADFGERYPITRKWCSAPAKMAKPNDILISVRAPIGALNYAKEECCIGRGLAALTPDQSKVSPEFIFWLLKAKNQEFNSKGTGSTFKAIGRNVLEETLVPDISMEKQKVFSNALGRAYAIIQNRKRQRQKLDDLVKARFVEMFESVQWNTVRASSIMSNMRNGVSPSNRGHIPAKVLTLSAITQGAFDPSKWKDGMFDTNPPVEKRVCTTDFYMCRGNGNKNLVGTGVYSTKNRFDLVFPDTVIAASIDLQRVCMPYLAYVWKRQAVRKQIESGARTTNGTYKVNQGVISSVEIPLPPIELQAEFADFVKQIDKSKAVVQKALDETQLLFDSLMQEYFG